MKKVVSLILALVMCISLLPATVAADGDIVFDFTAWITQHTEIARQTELTPAHIANIARSEIGTAQTAGIWWETNSVPKTLRLCNIRGDWETTDRTGGNGANNKIAFDITVAANQKGWYSLELPFTANSAENVYSIYMLSGGKATFLGDVKAGSGKTNAVYLSEGVNTLVICGVSVPSDAPLGTIYLQKLIFTRLADEPTLTLKTDVASNLKVGEEKKNLTVSMSMSDGTEYQFPTYVMNATTLQHGSKDTDNYIKVESQDPSVLSVVYAKSEGAFNKASTLYSIKALSEGETELVFTPVIGGVAKTEKTVRKTVRVTEDKFTGIKLVSEKTSVVIGKSVTVSPKEVWSGSGDKDLSASAVTLESLNEDIATVDVNGVVTGVAEGTATIKATYKEDTSKTATIDIAVTAAPVQRTYEYVMSQAGFNVDQMMSIDDYSGKPVIRKINGAMYFTTMFNWTYEVPAEYSATLPQESFMALDTTENDGDAKLTDKWALVANRGGSHMGNAFISKTTYQQQFQIGNYEEAGRENFGAFRLNVDVPGEYFLQAKAGNYSTGAATAVYFFEEGTDGVTVGNPKTYPEAKKLGYFNSASTKGYVYIGDVELPEEGNYILAFVADENSVDINPKTEIINAYDGQWFNLTSVKLVPKKADEVSSFVLTADKRELLGNGQAKLSAEVVWALKGYQYLEPGDVTFESSDEAVATVSADGVVTGVGTGTTTITATLKADPTKSETIDIKVTFPSDPHIFEFITSQEGFNMEKLFSTDDFSGKPVIRAINGGLYFKDMFDWNYEVPTEYSKDGIAFMALDTTEDDGDAKLTDKWALVANRGGSHLGSIHVLSTSLQQQFQPDNYTDPTRTNFAALRLELDAPGEYIVQAKAGVFPSGAVTASYFFKEGEDGISVTAPNDYPEEKMLSYFNSAKATDYTYIGNVTVGEMGNYILAFVADETSMSQNAVTLISNDIPFQWFHLAGIRLVPADMDYQTGLSVEAETDIIYNGEEIPLDVKETWEYAGEKEVSYSDIKFESSDNSKATVDENGIVTAISEGEVIITATQKSKPQFSEEFRFEIYDPDAENIGVQIVYDIGTDMMKDQTTYNPHNNRLEEATGRLRDLSYVDSFDEINGEKTELWAYNNLANITWKALEMDNLLLSPSPTDYPKGSFLALKLRVPVKGTYDVNIRQFPFTVGTEADVYFFPKGNIENVTLDTIADMSPIGHVDTRDFENRVQTAGSYTIERGGEYYIVFKFDTDNKYLTNTSRHYFSLQEIILKAPTGPFSQVKLGIETLDEAGEELYFNAYRKISYTLLDEFGNEIDGFNPELVEINDVSVTGEGVSVVYENGNYYVETEEIAGDASLTVDLTYRGKNIVTTFPFKVADIGKSGRTLYSDKMIAAAQENVKKYSWAREEKNKVVTQADKYLSLGLDFIWNSVTGQGVPRTYHVGYEGDGDEYLCRYCRVDLYKEGHGNYPFGVDPINDPWKIKCPECSRRFPSNDFGKFYELGRTKDNGNNFDRITALEAHREMLIAKNLLSEEALALEGPGEDCSEQWYLYYGYGVKGGYLHNDLYATVDNSTAKFDPNVETVARWGVDDSMGYNTGKKCASGVEEVHTYIGYYNHFAHFYIKDETFYLNAFNAFKKAYFYTGDEKYGVAGAILIDRLADIYPTYDLNAYLPRFANIDGGALSGKALGKIWECYVAEYLADAYDAFWPMFENEKVIDFLHNKAVYYGLENDKSTATKIRQNIEDGICREIFEVALDSKLNGNFGLNQLAVGNAAIALDHKKDSGEMIEWIYKTSWSNNRSYNTGGDTATRLVDVVYRDGQNYESPSYNNLGVTDLIKIAESLARYKENGGEFDEAPLLEHPKYLKLINSFQTLTLVRRGVKAIADSGQPAYLNKFPDAVPLATAFYYTKDSADPEIREEAIKMAQHLYMQQGKEGLKSKHFDIYTENPESLYDEVMAIIEEYGEYPYDKSSIMTGYGFAALRAGTLFEDAGPGVIRDTTRDFTLNFSGHSNHQHHDFLDLGMEAYGIGMTMDLGYPETALAGDPHTAQWSQTVLSHNTVMVDEQQMGKPVRISQPSLHFDAKDTRVKVIDAEIPIAYSQCNDYRRTIVMVDYDDEVSYGVDFFRVNGGKDHIYTFSPNSNDRPEHSDNLTFVKQVDDPQDSWIYDDNHYPFSSYAGADVQFGWDPYTDMSKVEAPKKFPLGYTWMFNVERCDNPNENEFWLDYAIKDFGKEPARNPNINIRLRVTMLNDFDADEVSLVSTKPQRVKDNEKVGDLEKFLVRRKGEKLDSLFTAVYEPYLAESRYVADIQSETLTVEKVAGEGTDNDAVKAVKVVIGDNRTDYIVYASNKNNTYKITDTETGYSFEFKGFVGVWTVNAEKENVYTYIHDGEMIGEGDAKLSDLESVVTGTVVDFQKELSLDNWIDVTFDRDFTQVEANDLVDRMMNIERDTLGNSSYVIEGITMTDARSARINLNSTSLISAHKDVMNLEEGYVYNIAEGQSFEIPMSYEDNGAPVFDAVEDKRVSAGSSINITVNATPITEDLTVSYAARTLPRGATFDAETATFSWKPTSAQTGTNLVAIDAIDSEGRVSTIYFEVEVLGSTSGGGGGGGGGIDLPPKEDEPTTDEPGTDEPGTDEPTGDEPGTDEPGTDEPGTDVPSGDKKGFTDLGNHAWAEESINALADEGIIKGTSEETFSPAANITRADYAILLVRAFELESDSTENFADVESSDYFAEELAVARNTGIVNGIGDNNYAPRKTITRQDMMVILYRALTKLGIELKPVEGLSVENYPDYANVADYAKEAVKALVEAGLVNGKSGRLAGDETTTRAEVAVLVKRIIDYIAK